MRASWGPRFDRYTHHNVAAPRSGCWRPRATHRRRSSSTRRRARSTATRSTLPTHEDETPRPLSPYGVTKLAAEHLCVLYGEEHGVDTVALRYFSVYGPRQRPDMAFRRFCEAIDAGDADRGLRRRPPDARLHLRRRHRRRHPRGGGARPRPAACTTSAAGPHEPELRAGGARRARRAPARRPPPRPRVRRRARHRRRHRPRAASSASRRRPTLEAGLAAELEWVRERDATRPGCGA